MPYLNWKDLQPENLEQTLAAHQTREYLLTLTLGQAKLRELLPLLAETFQNELELRIDLPKDWIVFFKTRSSDSRLLMAHPQRDEWVAMLAFQKDLGAKLVDTLREKVAGDSIFLSEVGEIGSVSNLEVQIIVK